MSQVKNLATEALKSCMPLLENVGSRVPSAKVMDVFHD